jgi:hypothetical protein
MASDSSFFWWQEAAVQARKQFKGLFDKKPGLLSEPVEVESQPAEADSQPEASPAPLEGQRSGELEEADKNAEDKEERSEDKGQDSDLEDDPFANSRSKKKTASYFRAVLNHFSQRRCSIL